MYIASNAFWTSWPWVVIKVITCFIFVTLNNLYAIPAYVLHTITLFPLRLWNFRLYEAIDGYLFQWLLDNVSAWMWVNGYTLVEAGDDLRPCHRDESLVMVNHQSTADVPALFYAMSHQGKVLNSSMWIMEHMFKYTNFGLVSCLREDFFIMQGKETRHLQGSLLKQHLKRVFWPRLRKWLFIFPEGGFLRKRLESSQQYAKKHDYPVLCHVTLPRVGAMAALMEHIPSHTNVISVGHAEGLHANQGIPNFRPMKWFVDITIGYPDHKALDLQSICLGWRKPCSTSLHYRFFPIHSVPKDTDELTKWLYARFVEKEHLLSVYHRTGKFPKLQKNQDFADFAQEGVELDEGRKIVSSNLYFMLVNLFYILSTAMYYFLFKSITSVLY